MKLLLYESVEWARSDAASRVVQIMILNHSAAAGAAGPAAETAAFHGI
jgi:hypothetical protein